MIDYQVLCQTIAEWKAGQRPSSGPHEQAASPEQVEEMESGVVMVEDADMTYEEMPEEQSEYEQEGEVTYGDEQAAAEYVEEPAPEAEPEDEDAGEEIAVDADDDDDEIPME